VAGYWRDADRPYCRDEKWRPVEPGTFPLAHGGCLKNERIALRRKLELWNNINGAHSWALNLWL